MNQLIITAPASAIGSQFIQYIRGSYEIITVGRNSGDILFDFGRDSLLPLPEGARAAVHFAGMFSEKRDTDILQMINTNVAGILRLCSAAKRSKIRQIIYISSISATLPQNSPYFSYYALTKRQAEEAARLYCRRNNIHLTILRPSQVFGASGIYAKHQPLLYIMMKNALQNLPIAIYGGHDALRNYIFADNLFRMIEEAIARCADETIDVVDTRNYSLSEIAHVIVKAFNSGSPIEFLPDKPDISDNPFSTDLNYFDKWNLPFVGLQEAMEQISKHRNALDL